MDATNSPTPPTTDPAPAAKSPYRPNRLTSGIVAGGAAFAMVLAGLGIASAQTDDSTTSEAPAASAPAEGERAGRPHRGHHHHAPRLTLAATFLDIELDDLRTQLQDGKTLAAIAGARTDELVAALVADGERHLDDAVAHGRLTQEEADEKQAELPERMTAFVNATLPAEGERVGPGGKHGGPGGRASLGTVASTLGITEDELRTQLQSGKSLADIAGDKTGAVVDALVAEATARIDQAVTDGKLTAEQATERKANLTERITAMVERTPTAEGERRGHRPGPPPVEDDAEAAPASVDA